MSFASEQDAIDWDAIWTLLLSFLIVAVTAAIPLFLTALYVLRIARNSSGYADSCNGYLVFGKKLIHGSVDEEYRQRLEKLLQLIHAQPEIPVLLLGGRTSVGAPSEAESGVRYLQQHGLPEQVSVSLEEQSINTLENLQNPRSMLLREQIDRVALISNRYHLARCQVIANSLEIEHSLCAAEPVLIINAVMLGKVLIEAAYIHWFVVGRGWARLIGNRRMLARVT